MSTLQTFAHSPRGYVLRSLQMPDGKFLQHAIVECSTPGCNRTVKTPMEADASILIIQKFSRMGWAIYKNGKARCPEHAEKRRKQQHHFVKLGETVSMPALETLRTISNEAKPAEPAPAKKPEPALYLIIIDPDGSATVHPIRDAVEMLLGDKAYFAVPR